MAHVEERRRKGRGGSLGAVNYRVRYLTPEGAERSRTFDARREAEGFLHTVEADIFRGTFIDPHAGQVTFAEFVAVWRDAQVHRVSTGQTVDAHLKNHLLPAFGHRPIGSIRTMEVQAFVRRLSTELAPATVELVFRYLSAIMAAATAERLISASPCAGRAVKLPRRPAGKVVPLATEVVWAAIDHMPAKFQALGILAASTGLREGELLGLTVPRLDMLRRQVTVTEQMVTAVRRPPFLGPPKTTASERTVPLPEVAVDALAAHLSRWPAVPTPTHRQRPTGDLAAVAEPLVFTNELGRPLRRQTFIQMWGGAIEAAGLDSRIRFHELRHYYASLLIEAGSSIKEVQARLGHASARETLDTYGHLWPDTEGRTRSAVDGLFGGARGNESGGEAEAR